MAFEKQMQSDTVELMEQPRSCPQIRRRCLFAMLGIGAMLVAGITIGVGVALYCERNAKGDSHVNLSSNHSVYYRDLPLNPVTSVLNTVTATRPHKFFGPTIAPDLAAAWRLEHGVQSVEKRKSDERPDTVEVRDVVEKRSLWRPSPGLSWTYQLSETPSQSQIQNAAQYNVWDIDLFDTPVSTIQAIQAAGSKVICYFSGGTAENWRSDYKKFKGSDIGNPMGDWPGENWINMRSVNVREIMAARLDLAASKGCDGVDPDNMDAYNHNTGFGLTQPDAINYVTYLAAQASIRGLAISLKNSADIIPSVVNLVQYSVEEACTAYGECDLYTPFTKAGKPVFHVEYPKGYGVVNTNRESVPAMAPICACKSEWNFSPIVKNNNLDDWQQNCS